MFSSGQQWAEMMRSLTLPLHPEREGYLMIFPATRKKSILPDVPIDVFDTTNGLAGDTEANKHRTLVLFKYFYASEKVSIRYKDESEFVTFFVRFETILVNFRTEIDGARDDLKFGFRLESVYGQNLKHYYSKHNVVGTNANICSRLDRKIGKND